MTWTPPSATAPVATAIVANLIAPIAPTLAAVDAEALTAACIPILAVACEATPLPAPSPAAAPGSTIAANILARAASDGASDLAARKSSHSSASPSRRSLRGSLIVLPSLPQWGQPRPKFLARTPQSRGHSSCGQLERLCNLG